jgi:hypothetical protein
MWGTFSDFILFVHRFGRTQGCLWMASSWRGHVWIAMEFNFSGDSAQNTLQRFPVLLISNYSPSVSFHYSGAQ